MKKKKFEFKHRILEGGQTQVGIFIDDELFDWEVDTNAVSKIIATGDQHLMKAVQDDIQKHFIESLSEFVGRKITFSDIKKAEKEGWI
jgi:hypothetical protein